MSDMGQSWLFPKLTCCPQFILNTLRSGLTQPFAFELILHHHVKELESQNNILLILLSHNWKHYSAVAAKCGLNLKKKKSDIISGEEVEENKIDSVDIFDYDYVYNDPFDYTFDWALFTEDISAKVNFLPHNSIVLIDDLSVLLSLDVTSSSIYRFVRLLRKELTKKQSILFIASNYVQEDEQMHQLITSLIYECDTWLDCNNPKSGYSSHINGIAKFNSKIDGSSFEMNYKLLNRNVIFTKI